MKIAAFILACVVGSLWSAVPAAAQQTLNFSFGRTMLPSDNRPETDVLLIEHADLLFEVGDFNSRILGGEWLRPINEHIEAGLSIFFSQSSVDAPHARFFNSDGTPLMRRLSLRQIPAALTARYLPLGQSYRVQPFIGGGLVATVWGFSESGDFVNANRQVFRDESYSADTTSLGMVVVLGLRFVGDGWAYGFEARQTRARGSFGDSFAHVQDPDMDLDNWAVLVTTGLRFR